QDADRVAGGPIEPGRDRHLVAKVAREVNDLEARVAPAQLGQQLRAPVRAPVVDEDYLRRPVEPVEHGAETPLQLRERVLLVEDRDDERVAQAFHASPMVEQRVQGQAPTSRRTSRSPASGPGQSSRMSSGSVRRTT